MSGGRGGTDRRLLAILAHPDDESLGAGGTLARYAAEGVTTHVVTATRGEAGRYFDDDRARPADEEVGRVREAELRAAAEVLGVRSVRVLGHPDGGLEGVPADVILPELVREIRRVRPQVVLTFDPYGAYGHPDHIAVSQAATAAAVAAADPEFGAAGEGPGDGVGEPSSHHRVAKLYYIAWDETTWAAYQEAFREMASRVDGEARTATPWPGWSVTTRIDTGPYAEQVWEAVRCHRTQMSIYGRLAELTPERHEDLWGIQTFYRVFSTVNGGRETETDLFAGID